MGPHFITFPGWASLLLCFLKFRIPGMLGSSSQKPFWPCSCRERWYHWNFDVDDAIKKVPMSRSQTNTSHWVFGPTKSNDLWARKWFNWHLTMYNLSTDIESKFLESFQQYPISANFKKVLAFLLEKITQISLGSSPVHISNVADVGRPWWCGCRRDARSTADFPASASRAFVPWNRDQPVPDVFGW